MSYLDRPRIGFFGTDAMVNPSTANNENIIHLLDYDRVQLLNPPTVEGATLPALDDAAYREWMTSLVVYADAETAATANPNWQSGMPGYWNYWGDHLTTFGRARATSVWVDDRPVTRPAEDPLLKAHFALNARIVDVNPADSYGTQFVAASFRIIGPDRDGDLVELVRGVPTTSFTRWLNFFRPGGAATFQAVIPNSALSFVDPARAPHSDGLRALREGAADGAGLLLRWCFYGMRTSFDQITMYEKFQRGERAMNPKIGRVVGTVGVWNGTDMVSAPVGRNLQQPGPPYSAAEGGTARAVTRMRVKTHEDVERIATPGTALNALSASSPDAERIGPAMAYVAEDRVVLDLGNTFPEVGGGDFDKVDFGGVVLELLYDVGGKQRRALIDVVDYEQGPYELYGGVLEYGFNPRSEAGQHIHDGLLQVRTDGVRVPLLREIETVQVTTDDQAVYLDMPAKGRAKGTAALRVFRKGEPITEPLTLTVQLWRDTQTPGRANSVNPLVLTATSIGEEKIREFTLEVPAGGRVEVPIEVDAAACYKLRYLPPDTHADRDNPAWAVEYFSTVRALPYDDYSGIPDDQLTFELVYREVFRYYALLYPIMGAIIPWGPVNVPNDPDRVTHFAALMLDVIDESRRGTALEMPITRELSAGKRALVQRWCRRELKS
ncbi:hypothetical protein OG792_13050 [Micromonospora sp. NBC_01699]|uniref:hypothetical protein n=1 Tax=Micromonospora sp. NBC_01699 TaxID=2975984 RepID=UPI002E37A220|nr:hypothetical protein [Micromonospora sp. NBC_01699]